MSKGTQTRTMILERSAPLFNQQGFFGASLSDIMHATGLEKGGIYNHFASKEQLALEAFDYAFSLHQQRVTNLLAGKRHGASQGLGAIRADCSSRSGRGDHRRWASASYSCGRRGTHRRD